MTIVTQALLFNADANGVSTSYGGEFDPAFLDALSAADPNGTTRSSVFRGDILVSSLCERVTAVSRKPRESSHTVGHDMDLYRTIIWDLADAFAGQWHTVNLETFPEILGRSRVYCICVATLPIELREEIDARLRPTNGYLGSVEIDLGNPIQQELFVKYLIKDAVIDSGSVVIELSSEGYAESSFDGADKFIPGGERRVPYGDLSNYQRPLPDVPEYSRRGHISAERYNGKRRYTVRGRILLALSRLWPQAGEPSAFAFDAFRENVVLEAELSEAKFVRYLLNREHADGRGKAKFFNDVLGIGADDWRYLAAQFYDGLKIADLTKLKVKVWEDGFGISFNCVMPVMGPNGRVAMIETNWILKPGLLPQLSTAFPAAADDTVQVDQNQLKVAPAPLVGDVKWAAIYAIAEKSASIAAEQCVPTPRKIPGFDVEMEGMGGHARVRLPDARKGFARWVVRSGKGRKNHTSGAAIYARVDSQSLDRAVAYAKAFAAVLHLNGIQCSVESRID
jgi:hypothetical protein